MSNPALDVSSSVFSVFMLLSLGYAIGRYTRVFSGGVNHLNAFALYIAVPAEIFLASSRLHIGTQLSAYILCYACATLVLWSLIAVAYGSVLHKSRRDVGLYLIGVGQSNTAYIAVPLFVATFGNASLVVPIIVMQSTLMTMVALLIIESGTGQTRSKGSVASSLARSARNPLIIAGLLGSLIGSIPTPPEVVRGFLEITGLVLTELAQTAMPVALIALGAGLGTERAGAIEATEGAELVLGVVFKCVLHPLLAFGFGRYVFQLPSEMLLGLTLVAAMPAPKNTFIFAQAYGVRSKKFDRLVILSTLGSLIAFGMILISLR